MASRGTVTLQPKFEPVQFFIRKHWTHFLKPVIFGLLIGFMGLLFFAILGYFVLMLRFAILESIFAFSFILCSILYLNSFFLQIINYYFDLVIVTDHRIIVARKTVFLKNDNDAIDLTKIQDIGVIAHGFLCNYLNYGALMITLSTATPPVYINFVPNPHFYLEQMNRVKRENILQRQERRGLLVSDANPRNDPYLQSVDRL